MTSGWIKAATALTPGVSRRMVTMAMPALGSSAGVWTDRSGRRVRRAGPGQAARLVRPNSSDPNVFRAYSGDPNNLPFLALRARARARARARLLLILGLLLLLLMVTVIVIMENDMILELLKHFYYCCY